MSVYPYVSHTSMPIGRRLHRLAEKNYVVECSGAAQPQDGTWQVRYRGYFINEETQCHHPVTQSYTSLEEVAAVLEERVIRNLHGDL